MVNQHPQEIDIRVNSLGGEFQACYIPKPKILVNISPIWVARFWLNQMSMGKKTQPFHAGSGYPGGKNSGCDPGSILKLDDELC